MPKPKKFETAIWMNQEELDALRDALNNIAIEMDDDGREGTFAKTPLHAIYRKLEIARILEVK